MPSQDLIAGANLIAGVSSQHGAGTFQATDASTGEKLPTRFREATVNEVQRAARAAHEAYQGYRTWTGAQIGTLLRAISEELVQLGDVLIDTARRETGLTDQRLLGERARTCAQFEMFAELVESGEHLDVIIDHADNSTTPPRPDLRRMKVPVGPVAVFGAANFPLAFSVPGGDTASALAAGCSVVIKAHPYHPATSELCAHALLRAADRVGAPAGIVNLVQGRGIEVGQALVLADEIRSVGFTGSAHGGRALHDLAAGREHPIPVHAEMGSINPVLVTPRALVQRGKEIASELVGSLTMGVGQFCTSPGLIFAPHGDHGDRFVESLTAELSVATPGPLLNQGVRDALAAQLRETTKDSRVQVLLDGDTTTSTYCGHTLLSVDFETYISNETIRQEHFGPASIVVRCPEGSWERVIDQLDGQLTLTLQAEVDDAPELRGLLHRLEETAGRIIFNAFPTGVAVTAAQHHGGPHPATNEPRFTSVGTTAIERFLRPVAFQNVPDALLPDQLLDANPLRVPQRVDGARRD